VGSRTIARSASVTIGAGGTGIVRFTGPAAFESIEVDAISLACGGATIPTAKLYRAPAPSSAALAATTLDGASGGFERTGSSDVIGSGEAWSVEWTGAEVGQLATATLTGTLNYRGG